MDPNQTSYTRAQLAAAVDEAHGHLHAWTLATQDDDAVSGAAHVDAAHEALHSVGAGLPRVGCATPDPEARAIYADLQAMRDRPLPCGHKIEDLIGGTDPTTGKPEVTKCGQCLADKQAEREAAPRTPETVLRAMLRAYEAAAFDAMAAYYRAEDGESEWARSDQLDDFVDELRVETAHLVAGYKGPDLTYPTVIADYEARLAGTRPLNAPPLEV